MDILIRDSFTLFTVSKHDETIDSYKYLFSVGWHVLVLGEISPDALQQQVEALLTLGTLVNLERERPDVIASLRDRRAQVTHVTDRAEAHYDTGEE